MSNENGENRGGELPDEQADALLDQLAARADERDDIDLRPGSKRTISRRSLLGAVGAAGAGALALGSGNAEAQTGQWGNATGSAGTESKPFSEAWVQDLYSKSIATDEIDTERRVGADDDLQTVYDNAPADGKVVIVEEHEVDSSFSINRDLGPVVEFRAPVVPTGDFTPLVITADTSIDVRKTNAITEDKNNVTTSGTPGVLHHGKVETVGTAAVRDFGGHGWHALQSADSHNLNNSEIRVISAYNGGDGVRVENTSGNADDINEMSVRVPLSYQNGGKGFNAIDGISNHYHVFSQDNTGAAGKIDGRNHIVEWSSEANGSKLSVNATDSEIRGSFRDGHPKIVPDSTLVATGGTIYADDGAGASATAMEFANPSANDGAEAVEIPITGEGGTVLATFRVRGDGRVEWQDLTNFVPRSTMSLWVDDDEANLNVPVKTSAPSNPQDQDVVIQDGSSWDPAGTGSRTLLQYNSGTSSWEQI